MSFLAELKRRNVIRVAIGYLAVSWLLMQAGSLMFGVFDLPASAMRGLFVLLVMAFVPTLVFSWIYELTPEGLKRTSEVDRGESITHLTGRKLDYLVIGVLVAAVVLLLIDKFALAPRREAAEVRAALEQAKSPTAGTGNAVSGTSAVAGAGTDAGIPEIDKDPSIAVLPFANLSSDKEQEYFSEGISEELLNLLAKVPRLRVIARTSSFSFKGKEASVAEIARALKVAAVLEGSVRKSADHVRITVQLIRAIDSSHLWSETYDRTLDDIFKTQDEIAAAVVGQLKIKLLGAVPTTKPVDPKVYPLLLQASALVDQGSAKAHPKAIELYQEALKIAPDTARAWAGLAFVYRAQANAGERSMTDGYSLAREAASKALSIDPENGETHTELGRVAAEFDRDLAAAARHYQRALELEPGNTDVLNSVAITLQSIARIDDAIAVYQYIVAVDPTRSRGYHNLGIALKKIGRLDDSIAASRTALALSPQRSSTHYGIGEALLAKGDAEGSLAEMQAEPSEAWRMIGLPMAYYALGRKADSDVALAALIAKDAQDGPYNIACVHAFRGEPDRAFEWLEKAITYRDGGLVSVAVEPLFANIHNDPRWLPFLRKIGFAPEQLAKIELKVTLPAQVPQ
jgi:TolB-like protein/Tfp pilus assembly protein PilF